MNNTVLNGLQLYTKKTASGLTTEQQLSHLLLTKPHQMSSMLSMIFGAYKKEQVSVLDFITRGLGNVKTIEATNSEYMWDVDIDVDKAIPIVRAEWQGSTIASTDTPGIGNTPITLWLADRWFGPGALISFDNRDYQVRVQNDGEPDGDVYKYIVVISDGNPESYIPPTYLAQGKKVSRDGSAYEEGSEQADIVNYSAPFKLKNQMTTLRLQYGVTRTAATDKMILEYTNPTTGKKSYMWDEYQTWKALRQWYQMKDMNLMYSKYNSRPDGTINVMGSTQRVVRTGAGLLQQISPANTREYTTMTPSLIEDFISDLSFNKLGFGERKFMALTGEMGMRAFSKMLENKAAAFQLVDTHFISGSGQDLTFGGQFRTWKMYNGAELTLSHFPWLNNTTYNRILDPVTGRPASSYDMYFFDISYGDKGSNIKKIIKTGSENLIWTVGGSILPGMDMAKSTSTMRSNAMDGYNVNLLSEEGLMLEDPTTSGKLKYAIEE